MSALDRTRRLLLPQHQKVELNDAGYLDLLEEDVPSTGPAQDLMLSRLIPQIYERWWRPALARVVKGVTGPGMGEEVRIARLMLALSRGDEVLDVACGPGTFTREFARTVGEDGLAIGLDSSETMLRRGVEELRGSGLSNMLLVRGSATDLPFRDRSFEGVACYAALHLLDDPMEALDEFTRVLKKDGRIALMTSVRRPVTPRLARPVVERTSGMRLFDRDEIVDALRQRGFDELHQRMSGLVQFVGGRLTA
jgi:ubiquinone/menaquinone biosynthesis C-methylase UbiE